MKRNLLLLATFIFLILTQTSFAQWQSNGPDGGSMLSLANLDSYTFTGTSNGVFSTTDNGLTWVASNAGLQRKSITGLAALGNNIFAATAFNGVFISSDYGATWTPVNTGLSDTIVISIFSDSSGIFAGTPTGVFYSSDGQSWALANNGIPSTYPIYSFVAYDSIVYGGTYGLGLYATIDSGANWTSVAGGFPPNSFVYALIGDSTNLFAGTSDGVYKSIDGGANWSPSNTGFPTGMWAHSFAMSQGYVYAGTYNSGVLLSIDSGNTWTPMNNGIPDLPLSTGLLTNYPSVQAMIGSGANVLAATNFGMYMSEDSASSWQEANKGILATIVTSIDANDSIVIAGTSGTGVYVSMDAGNSWIREINGLTNEYVLAVVTTKSWLFTSVENTKVFRSNNNGSLWNPASNGLQASVKAFRPDTTRIVALTQGQQFTPPALYETADNGQNWTTIPDPGIGYLSSIGLIDNYIFVGTDTGGVFVTNTNGSTWQDLSSNLPNTNITAILPIDTDTVFVGTETMGIYMSINGGNWTPLNSGITNMNITDLRLQASVLYASTLGGGVFYSLNFGNTWIAYNVGLDNLYVSALASDALTLYAATDAGVYSEMAIINGIQQPIFSSLKVFPNPTSGKFYINNLPNEKTLIRIYNAVGKIAFEYDGYPTDYFFVDLSNQSAGIYFMVLQSEKQTSVKKIILQKQ